MKKHIALIIFLTIVNGVVFSQQYIPGKPVICTYNNQIKSQLKHKISTALIEDSAVPQSLSINEITYTSVPANAIPAIQKAVNIWSNLLVSKIPIRIHVIWTSLSGSIVASTRATRLYKGFQGAIQKDVWYPVALAEKISNEELNNNQPDIEVTLNENISWYYGSDGNTPSDKLDLLTITLHEIAHGLGFTSFAHVDGDKGILRDDNLLSIYDLLLENGNRSRLSAFPDASLGMFTQLTSNNLFIFSPTAAKSINGNFPKVYAPIYFNAGSSISHLDEQRYLQGDPNSLMTPIFLMGESIHTPGALLLGILADLGWNYENTSESPIIIYPNPSSGIFKISMPLNIGPSAISLIDMAGRLIKKNGEILLNGSENQIDLSFLPDGVYTLIIITPSVKISKKLIVLK